MLAPSSHLFYYPMPRMCAAGSSDRCWPEDIYIYPILSIFTVVFCYTRACNICSYFTSVIFLCTAHARNNEKERVEEVELLVLGLEFWAIR